MLDRQETRLFDLAWIERKFRRAMIYQILRIKMLVGTIVLIAFVSHDIPNPVHPEKPKNPDALVGMWENARNVSMDC
jgi:hypothetical protein